MDPKGKLMSQAKEVVFADDPRAAEPVTVTAYKSLDGHIYLHEQAARYGSATHSRCDECSAPTVKGWSLCDDHRIKANDAKYAALDAAPQRKDGLLYSRATEKFTDDPDELLEELENEGYEVFTLEDLQLVCTDPHYPSQFDLADYDVELAPEDQVNEWSEEVVNAVTALNAAFAAHQPLSWRPNGKRWNGEWLEPTKTIAS
jgi:hypothetical protein